MFFEQRVPVLVSEDTIYRREDHSKRLLLYGRPLRAGQPFNRLTPPKPNPALFFDTFASVYGKQEAYSQITIPVTTGTPQPFFLRYQSPSPFLFLDTFVGVYSKTEAVWQITPLASSPPQPAFLYFTKNRPKPDFFEDHSLESGQTNHPFPHVIQVGLGLLPYSFEIPDLNNDPWLDPVRLYPAANMYPFRQILRPAPPQQVMLQMFYKAPNWQVEAEPIWRVEDQQTLNQFRWQVVIPTVPNVIGDLQAVGVGILNAANFFNIVIVPVPSSQAVGIIVGQDVIGVVTNFNVLITLQVSIGPLPSGSVLMPDVVGLILQEAEQVLQETGVVVISKLGFFGTYPVTVITQATIGRPHTVDASINYRRRSGYVVAQIPAAGQAIIPNSPVTLIINEFAGGFVFPAGVNR
jgi:PASTA domain